MNTSQRNANDFNIDALKAKFSSGEVPTQKDFSDLIELADIGRNSIKPGMILMFSGHEVPAGWALCDGENGTPNLKDRFILGGDLNVAHPKGGKSLYAHGNDKAYTVYTNQATPKIQVDVAPHRLTIDEMPSHNHTQLYSWENKGYGYTSIKVANIPQSERMARKSMLESTGGNAAHKHTATAQQNSHHHIVTDLPAYYILALIMKL